MTLLKGYSLSVGWEVQGSLKQYWLIGQRRGVQIFPYLLKVPSVKVGHRHKKLNLGLWGWLCPYSFDPLAEPNGVNFLPT